MNRQRRLEAIARNRAFIESQMLMLNTKESKVPNIIRSRKSIVQSGRPRVPNFQSVEHVSSEVSSVPDNEQVYLTIVDGSEVGFTGEGVEGNVPVVISEEICKVLENGDQCLQTIRTEDGTIMVVIEGGEEGGGDEETVPVDVIGTQSKVEKVKSCVKRKVVKKKPVNVCTEVVKKLKVESIVRDNEKPRPFRFELDEDDGGFGGFMSVPVPIAIGSLKSQTGKLDRGEFEQLDKLLPQTTHTPEQNLVIKSTNSLQTQEPPPETSKNTTEPDQAPVTIQSARADRTVDESNESLGFSFRNLFEQVTSNIVFN